jgi:hypothetical protein
MATLQRLACFISFFFLPTAAFAAGWVPWSSPDEPSVVGARFLHDDGGALLILCNTSKHLISYIINEPRAAWQEGSKIQVTTRADDGLETGPSTGHVVSPNALTVLEESTWDISTMGKATVFFAMGAGGYARIFPTDTSRLQWTRSSARAAITGDDGSIRFDNRVKKSITNLSANCQG